MLSAAVVVRVTAKVVCVLMVVLCVTPSARAHDEASRLSEAEQEAADAVMLFLLRSPVQTV